MEITENNWKMITTVLKTSIKSSFCCSLGTITPDGLPHVTPIASFVFTGVGKAFYFEKYSSICAENIRKNNSVCVMAVNSKYSYWLNFLAFGKFKTIPGLRLYGKVGVKRAGTEEEIHIWQKHISPFKRFKGYGILWKDMKYGREIEFTSFEPVQCGETTKKAVSKLSI